MPICDKWLLIRCCVGGRRDVAEVAGEEKYDVQAYRKQYIFPASPMYARANVQIIIQ